MVDIRWDLSKADKLKKERGVSFEEILQGNLLAVMGHPRRTSQKIMLFEYQNYVWVVPYVARGNTIFLKTLFPSRKYTKLWKKGGLI